MNIETIGAGNVGAALGKRFAAKGHRILISFARTDQWLATPIGVGSPRE